MTLLKRRIAVVSFLLFALPVHAREMQGRLGLGYNSEFSNASGPNGVPGLSLKYGLTREIAAEAVFGVNTTSPLNMVTGIKFFKNVFFETNLNFYFMLGGALENINSNSGAEFIGGLGLEFFIPGLESLGLAMETGGSVGNASGSFAAKTLGVSFLNAGMHFYF